MMSLKTLLNPAPPGPEARPSFRQSPTIASPTFSVATDVSTASLDRSIMPRLRASKESNNLAKPKVRGLVKYAPFENLDEGSLMEVRRFQVEPLGKIQQSCSHIPYNSGKKDFFEKTGRDAFEVFRYGFKVADPKDPDHDIEYCVMWDYNVGLVRMTPFFKCCGYGKTMPAKMLALNPGLKEITHSITGGSIVAQGYWMPYECAKAVCATFCYRIAGALIPLFGPSFPSQCFPENSPDFGRMVINPQLVIEASNEADLARRFNSSAIPPSFANPTSYPRRERLAPRSVYGLGHHHDDRSMSFRPRLVCDPAWLSDSEADVYHSTPNSASSMGSGVHGYMITSRPHSNWAPANAPQYDPYHQPNPWLSAVPRIQPPPPPPPPPPQQVQPPHHHHHHHHSLSSPSWGTKRRFEYEESEFAYEGSASPNISMSSAIMTDSPLASPTRDPGVPPPNSDQQSAAMLLLNFSMQEQHHPATGVGVEVGPPSVVSPAVQSPVSWATDMHRSKRQRAASF